LQEAIVEAQPVPNMLALYDAMRAELPEAEHFILSARMPSMRRDTLEWLRRHGLTPTDGTVCFVPYATEKPRVWRQLARNSKLVIVDDLSYDHASEQPSVHDDLVALAEDMASVYIGLDQIAKIAADSGAIQGLAAGTAKQLAAAG
jgi:hypothetical protein